MRILRVFPCICTFIIVATLPVQAQTSGTSTPVQTENAVEPAKPSGQVDTTNKMNSGQQKAPQPALMAGLDRRRLLYGDLMILSAGYPTSGNVRLGLGSNFGKLVAVDVSYMTGSQDVSAFGLSLGKVDQQIYGGSIRLYPFLGSLNVIGFYGQRWLTTTLKRDDILNGTEVNVRQKVAGGGFGNRWHLGSLQIGFDWVMYYAPVSKAKVSSKIGGRELSAADRDNLQDGIKKVENMPSMSFLNLSIGIGFI